MVYFISGCSTGFGRLLSLRLIGLGHQVVVTARNLADIANIGVGFEQDVLRLKLDVTNDLQVDEAVSAALAKFGKIDVLVNNAGYGYFGTQEEGEVEQVSKMFDVNVLGLIRLSKRVIPLMRKNRSGTIVNISSVAGRMATPRGGFYPATKWAVEAISEAQYLELASFGMRVVLIEPGAFQTDFGSRSAVRAPAEELSNSPYTEIRKEWIANASRELFPHSQNPNDVVDAIICGVEGDKPFVRIPVGEDSIHITNQRDKLSMDGFVEWMKGVYQGETRS